MLSAGFIFVFSTIATIATIAVIRSQLYLFQNCHNWDDCDEKGSIFFFFKIAIIATIDVTRIFQNCFRIFSLKIFRGPRTHVFVKYFAGLGLCCACGGPLTNWNSMDTRTQSSVFKGNVFTRTCWSFRYAKLLFSNIFVEIFRGPRTHVFVKIFHGPQTLLRLRQAAYKLELY